MPIRSRLFVVMAAMGSSLVFGGWLLGRGLRSGAHGPVDGERLFDQVVQHVRRYYVDSVSTADLLNDVGDLYAAGADAFSDVGDLSRRRGRPVAEGVA